MKWLIKLETRDQTFGRTDELVNGNLLNAKLMKMGVYNGNNNEPVGSFDFTIVYSEKCYS